MMLNQPPDLLIFDCDGVLVDSESISLDALYEMIFSQNIEISKGDLKRLSIGKSVKATVETINNRFKKRIDNATIDMMNASLFDRLAKELRAIAGIRSALSRISIPKCVASSSGLERIHISLRAAGMLEEFRPNIFSGDMVHAGKPAPDLFLLAAKTMGAHPRRCIVIEDSPAGIEAAQRAGMLAFAFCGGSHVDEDLTAAVYSSNPELVFDDMSDLPSLLVINLHDQKMPPQILGRRS
jgi:HAD superfamily hydrolase (TIGR01509 family)